MKKVKLRMCSICHTHKVGLHRWLLGNKVCHKCREESAVREMEEYGRQVDAILFELEKIEKSKKAE